MLRYYINFKTKIFQHVCMYILPTTEKAPLEDSQAPKLLHLYPYTQLLRKKHKDLNN